MRRLRTPFLICLGLVVPSAAVWAESLQSSRDGGALWATREGAEIVLGGVAESPVRIELAPGATIRTLEPIADGWVAAGRLPDGDGTDLLLLAGGVDGADLLAVPERGKARYRGQPFLFLEENALVGLAWSAGEGPRKFEIWAAPWHGDRWGTPELISPKGVGSQVAPHGAVLDDGSWLLVWTAFDGQDCEVVWSRRQAGAWTDPAPIHAPNEAPDVTPDVVVTDGGALAAWSWYDGNDYRLRTARLSPGGWIVSEPFGGKGSGEPRFLHTADRILLLYPSVVPEAWTVLEFDRDGDKRREAVVYGDAYERPLLLLEVAGDDLLRWSSRDQVLTWQDPR